MGDVGSLGSRSGKWVGGGERRAGFNVHSARGEEKQRGGSGKFSDQLPCIIIIAEDGLTRKFLLSELEVKVERGVEEGTQGHTEEVRAEAS